MKREIKDSVFTYLFRQPEYMLELYRTLHPEDSTTTEADLKLVTVENILTDGHYNDLGIQAKDKLLLLMEAQSTFSVNISLRLLLYLAETYKEYVEENKLDLYAGKAVHIPRPELYVVYTGSKADVPEVLRLSELYEGAGSAEITVKVLRSRGSRDIVDQYIRFCKVADEQRRKYGYTQEAIDETIRLCLDEEILTPFLASRKKEVTDIMVTLFSQEKVLEIHDYNIAKEARILGHAEERLSSIRKLMVTLNLSAVQAMDALMIPEEERSQYLSLLDGSEA